MSDWSRVLCDGGVGAKVLRCDLGGSKVIADSICLWGLYMSGKQDLSQHRVNLL